MMQGKKIRACDFYLRGFLYLDLFSALFVILPMALYLIGDLLFKCLNVWLFFREKTE
jgi:hypothetical protein